MRPHPSCHGLGLFLNTDHSFGADLARIKYYRNSIHGHVNENMELAGNELSRLWREISEALVRIAGQISPAKSKEWKNAIDKFLKDPLTEEDKRHEQELQRWYQNDTEVKKYLEKVESSMKHLEKEARSLRQEVQEKAQDIKDELGGKVESAVQQVQHLRQDVKDIKDRLDIDGRPNSSAGGQLVDLFCISVISKVFSSNIDTYATYQGYLYGAHCALILTEMAWYIFEA